MELNNLSAEEVKAARERLASRKTFFGGSVSTREEASAPGFKLRTQASVKASQKTRDRTKEPKGTGQQTCNPTAKRPRDTADDFGDLDDYNDPPNKPCTAGAKLKAAQAGDMWGRYLSAQRKKEDAEHVPAAKQRLAGLTMQSRPLATGVLPKRSRPEADKQKSSGLAGGSSVRLPPVIGRNSQIARASTPGGRLRAPASEEEDDLDGFIDDSAGGEDWRSELQAVTGYDPSKFAHVRDNARMVASRVEIEREERQSKRIGRAEDEKAEEEERRLRALKEAKMERHRSKRRKGASSALLLD